MDRILARPDADTMLALVDQLGQARTDRIDTDDVDFAALMAAHAADTSGLGSPQHRAACAVLADFRAEVGS